MGDVQRTSSAIRADLIKQKCIPQTKGVSIESHVSEQRHNVGKKKNIQRISFPYARRRVMWRTADFISKTPERPLERFSKLQHSHISAQKIIWPDNVTVACCFQIRGIFWWPSILPKDVRLTKPKAHEGKTWKLKRSIQPVNASQLPVIVVCQRFPYCER